MYVIDVDSYHFNVNKPKFIHIDHSNIELIDHLTEGAITEYRQAQVNELIIKFQIYRKLHINGVKGYLWLLVLINPKFIHIGHRNVELKMQLQNPNSHA